MAVTERFTSREQLILAASDLMVERESIVVTLSEIAERSGLNSALVKYYFGSKDQLMLATLLHVAGPGLTALDVLAKADMPASRKLDVHLSGMINTYSRYPYINRLIKYLTRDRARPECKEVEDKFIRPFARNQNEIIRQGVASGEFRDVDPILVHLSIVGACEALLDARYALTHAYGIETISDDLRHAYIAHVRAMVMNGIHRD